MTEAARNEARILAIEDRLAEDTGGVERDALRAQLAELAGNVRVNLDKGLPPDDAYRAKALISAIEAAQAVVERVWVHFNRRR